MLIIHVPLVYNINLGKLSHVTTINLIKLLGWHPILGLDGLNIPMVVLIAILIPIAILNSKYSKYKLLHTIILLLLESILLIVFIALDTILFYMAFETILIPMFLLIGILGARGTKLQACYLFMLYTLVTSILLLLGLILLYIQTGSTSLLINYSITWTLAWEKLVYISLLISFIAKLPMAPLHL